MTHWTAARPYNNDIGPERIPDRYVPRSPARDVHPDGAVAVKGASIDCANGDHRLCLADWCGCQARDCAHRDVGRHDGEAHG
jgi:hypothetical protein